MEKIKIIACFTLLITLFASCDFSEVCQYTGSVKLKLDPELTDSVIGSQEIVALAYPISVANQVNQPVYEINISNIDLAVGDYLFFMLAYDKGAYILNNIDDSQKLMLSVITTTKSDNGRIATVLPPVYLSKNLTMSIKQDDTTSIVLDSKPFTQQLEFKIQFKGDAAGEVLSGTFSLGGIATQKYLLSEALGTESAALVFTAKPNESALLDKKVNILGISSGNTNMFQIELLLNGSKTILTNIDLTDRLKDFVAEKVVIDIDMVISELSVDAEIINWREIDGGNSEIE